MENNRSTEAPITISTVYTFAMAKQVYVQLIGVDKTIIISADQIERQEGPDAKWIVKKGDNQVGQFRIDQVAGWWIEDIHRRD